MRAIAVSVWLITIASGADLVRNGASQYSICLSPAASASEERAAAELQTFLEQMSGARLPLKTGCRNASQRSLVVGEGPATGALRVKVPGGAEEFVLRTVGERLVIAGGRQRGTMYGVYSLLDRLGCRWFTAEVSRIPAVKTIALPQVDETGRPAFEYREPFFTEAWDRDWAARNRTNGNSSKLDVSTGGKIQYHPFVHSFNELIPPEQYFAAHPEYFSLIGGKRRSERSQLCLTNPEVLRLSTDKVLEWIARHPDATIFSVSQNDWEGWCECESCQRVEREEGGTHSGPLLRFVNAVAEQVEKQHPGKLIDTLAYWYTEDPPLKVKPRRNVRIRLCPIGICIAHPMEQCPRSAYFVENLRAWSKITNQLYIWHYNTNFSHYLAPVPDFDELAADVPLYRRHGVAGLFLQGSYAPGGGGENSELRAYVLARLLWNPNTNAEVAVNEFLEGVYGEAAPAMRSYYDLLHKEVRTPPQGFGQHLWIFTLPRYSEGFRAKAEDLFRQAESSAGDAAVLRRIKKAHLPLEYLDLARASQYEVRVDTYAPADLTALQKRWSDFLAVLPGFGITSIHEGRDLKWNAERVAALRGYAVTTLQNGSVRADIVPDLAGRVVRLVDRASGRDALRRPDPGDGGYPMTGGLLVEAAPDYVARPWPSRWTLTAATGEEATLQCDLQNGLHLTERLKLGERGVAIEAEVENRSAQPVPVAVRITGSFDPGDIDSLALQAPGTAGPPVLRRLLTAGKPPEGSAILEDGALAEGEIWFADTGGRKAAARFERGAMGRVVASWSAKGVPRAGLAVWSKPLVLDRGQRAASGAAFVIPARSGN